ncbi:MAG TPA: nickel-binding protein [Terriglobia bacterium]|nr:nickel-binding protein [Terriglobia bacterium]
MELVLVERRFEEPVLFEEIQALENAGAWCLDAHRVRYMKTFFSRDRRRMLCLYEAPDAESVRLAETKARVPFERAWSCMSLPGSEDGAAWPAAGEDVVVVREFPQPATMEYVMNSCRNHAWCLDLYNAHRVGSYLANDGLRMVCHFRAPDAESVRMANERGSAPMTEVWTATIFPPEG